MRKKKKVRIEVNKLFLHTTSKFQTILFTLTFVHQS